jgi:hypothetical protein
VALKYDTTIDRESAYEHLSGREAQASKAKEDLAKAEKAAAEASKARRTQVAYKPDNYAPKPKAPARRSTRQTPVEAATNTVMRTAARELTQFVFRGMFGGRKR